MDKLFEGPRRRDLHELNLVPIIDMFTTVVFFLLLSTTFLALTKLSVPPSRLSAVSDPSKLPPVNPKLLIGRGPAGLQALLAWSGKEPGEKRVALGDGEKSTETLTASLNELVAKFPGEKSVQLGLAREVDLQNLVRAMDALKNASLDVVLVSYDEAERRFTEKGPNP